MCHCCGKPPFVEGENYIVAPGGCWVWIGNVYHTGHARITYRHKRWQAHRLAYVLRHGDVPDDEVIHHTCENKRCINVDHLKAMGRREHFNGHKNPTWFAKMVKTRAERNIKSTPPRTPEKLSPQQRDSMKALYESGARTQMELATDFGVSQSTVSRTLLSQP